LLPYFSLSLFASAMLLFLVQPMIGKMILPQLGGTPAVWNTCMVFFQAGLLLGYAYAHALPRWLGVSKQALLHVALLIAAYFLLPIRLPDEIASGWHPVLWLLASLAVAVGLPFVLLAAGAPLLQRWFVCKHQQSPRDPYFLYAASNLGSFLALGLFPFVLEPWLTLTQQSDIWRYGFLAVTALMAFCVPLRVSESRVTTIPAEPSPHWRQRGRWIALSLIPSSLLLSVTTHVTTDIAAIPLLWLMPMGLYLLTFTAAFASRQIVPHALLVRWLPMVVIVVSIVLLSEATQPLALVLGVHLLGFVWLALLCHGELARTRPAAAHLTDFYLCLALGGVLGGVLNALVAPLVFNSLAEYPLMIVAGCYFGMAPLSRPNRADWLWAAGIGALTVLLILTMQSPWLAKTTDSLDNLSILVLFGMPFILCYITQTRPVRFALSLGAILLASVLQHGVHGTTVFRERSYYGIHRVTEKDGLRRLVHGDTVHGQQSLDPERRREPLTYYSKIGPIGDLFRTFHGDPRLKHVGIVGLGAGSLAAISQRGDDWTFFEIDPSVRRIAEDPKLFTYLNDAKGTIGSDLGDARLQLKRSTQMFGVLIVDAFGSDAIPMHLLTREAMQIYLDHLEPNGLLAFHISNNYVDLEPVLARLGEAVQPRLVGYVRKHRDLSDGEKAQGIMPSDWAIFARNGDDLEPLLPKSAGQWRPVKTRANVSLWTDDHSNLFQVFRWRSDD
jgi:spermidine synthase